MPKPKRHLHATVQETASPPETLTPTQSIARVEKAEGNSLYTCRLANDTSILVSLPARFRNVIWLKRGGFVLVDLKVAEGKVAGEIVNVVRNEKEWKRMTWWPEVFAKSAIHDEESEEDDSVVGKMPPNASDDE